MSDNAPPPRAALEAAACGRPRLWPRQGCGAEVLPPTAPAGVHRSRGPTKPMYLQQQSRHCQHRFRIRKQLFWGFVYHGRHTSDRCPHEGISGRSDVGLQESSWLRRRLPPEQGVLWRPAWSLRSQLARNAARRWDVNPAEKQKLSTFHGKPSGRAPSRRPGQAQASEVGCVEGTAEGFTQRSRSLNSLGFPAMAPDRSREQ